MVLVLCLRWKGQWQTTVMSPTQLVHPAPLYCQTVDSGYITEVDVIVSVFSMLQPFTHSYYRPGVMQFSFLLMLSQKADEEERPQVKQEAADKPSSSDTSSEMPPQATSKEISGDREEAVQQEQEEQEHLSEEVEVQTHHTTQSRETTSPFWVERARCRTGNCIEVRIICMINIHVQFFYV